MVRDISGRRRREVEQQLLVTRETDARQQAERASIMKDEFLATLSHELRTPLTTILSWVQVLRLGGVEPEEVNRALAVIEKSAQDQSQLIDDLLDVSRIQEGKLSLQPRKISPHDSLRAAVDSVWRQADSKSLRIDTDFDPSVDTMTADPVRLEQVFRNLLSNAVKFTPHGGTITVRSKVNRDRGEIEFRVEDTGKGIRPEFLPFLFTRFSQEDASATRAHFGLGLGLAIVRELVEKHGGAVKAFSPGEGQGSIFTVILPYERGDRPQVGVASTESQRTADKGSEQLPDLSGVRALVIDDLEDARAALSAMLSSSATSPCLKQADSISFAAFGNWTLDTVAKHRPLL
jgi:signal transduction histidine kinase